MDDQAANPQRFTRTVLPWLLGGTALVLYLVTLNHWVTLKSLGTTAGVLGWNWWQPNVERPFFFLLTWPVHWLPSGFQLTALNLFSAACAALALAQLARSVALLPQDRTREQRQREPDRFSLLSTPTNWIPPVFTVLVCGLQLTFWEHATAGTGEMLDLLLFAFLIRCLLEYRLAAALRWLNAFAVVYGVAIANNWAMISFLPLFLIALIWIMGRAFFDLRFLGRSVLFALPGLAIYLFLPAVGGFGAASLASFSELLHWELGAQKNSLLAYPLSNFILLSVTSVIPLIGIGIRWPSSFGDTSSEGAVFTSLAFRLVTAMLLLACLWIQFDSRLSPYELGYGLPCLTFYYLSALCIGYFTGYLLLVFGTDPGKSWMKPSPLFRLVNRLVLSVVYLAIVGITIILFLFNAPVIQWTNGPSLRQYAAALVNSLPADGIVIQDDGMTRLLLIAASQHGAPSNHVLVAARSLALPKYHQVMAERHGKQWPTFPVISQSKESLPPLLVTKFILTLAQKPPVTYLNPAFGAYHFEVLDLRPHGLAYAASIYPEKTYLPARLTPQEIVAQSEFLRQAAVGIPTKTTAATPGGPDEKWLAMQHAIHLDDSAPRVADANWLAMQMSLSADVWGVRLQREGHLDEARAAFDLALKCAPENSSAQVSRETNLRLRPDPSATSPAAIQSVDRLGLLRTWSALLSNYGPLDAQDACLQLGATLTKASLGRQAAREFYRATELNPTNLAARVSLGEALVESQLPAAAQQLIRDTRALPALTPTLAENDSPLVRLEATIYLSQTNYAGAEHLLKTARQARPNDPVLLESLFETYLFSRQFTNALATVNEHLELLPDNPRALLNKGALYIKLKRYPEAIATLDHLLKVQPGHLAGLTDRGRAYMELGKLDEAEKDYLALREGAPNIDTTYTALGEIALKRHRDSDAIKYFKEALARTPPGTSQASFLEKRIQDLKAAPH